MTLKTPVRILTGMLLTALPGIATITLADTLLIENVTLIDGTGRPSVAGASVLVDGDRISRIARGSIDAPRGTNRIDGSGKFLMPGLMDMHIHLRGSFELTP